LSRLEVEKLEAPRDPAMELRSRAFGKESLCHFDDDTATTDAAISRNVFASSSNNSIKNKNSLGAALERPNAIRTSNPFTHNV
jgi:hypothetical protein